ncbi:MAG: hypothetical protein ACREQN_10335 [Candidatus Binataceae bacterium]
MAVGVDAGWFRLRGAAGGLLALLIIIGVNVAIRYTGVYLAARQFTVQSPSVGARFGEAASIIFVLPLAGNFGPFSVSGRNTPVRLREADLVMYVWGERRSGLLYLHLDEQPNDWTVADAKVCKPFSCERLK